MRCKDKLTLGLLVRRERRRFAVIYVPPSITVLKATKDASFTAGRRKVQKIFSKGDILIRRGPQSIRANPDEIKFIERRATETGHKIGLLSGK
ncbi:MAG: hypothetical protein WED04_12815 [Promethearchaeati archaeon SRVP18_Atabeyarchaeia-1]